MRPLICDICGALEATGNNNDGARIIWMYRFIGRFYPEDICSRCGNDISNYLTQAKATYDRQRQEAQEQKDKPKAKEVVEAIEEGQNYAEDKNPATQ